MMRDLLQQKKPPHECEGLSVCRERYLNRCHFFFSDFHVFDGNHADLVATLVLVFELHHAVYE